MIELHMIEAGKVVMKRRCQSVEQANRKADALVAAGETRHLQIVVKERGKMTDVIGSRNTGPARAAIEHPSFAL